MKNQKVRVKNVIAASTLLFIVLMMVSCMNNDGTKKQKELTPPAMDLQSATMLGDLETILLHIEAGSNLDEKEPTMASSPLMTAAVFNRTEIAKALIDAGADLNFQNSVGSTPLHTAAFLCRTEIVAMLIKKGADKGILNTYGSTALESVIAPFEMVKPIYDQFSKDLGPLGFKLDYEELEKTRPIIADMLK